MCILKRLKLSFPQAVRVRRDRIDYTRGHIAKEFGISRALVTKTCQYTDAELLRMYSDYDNPVFNHIRISNVNEYDNNVDGRVCVQYLDGPLVGGYTIPSLYYLLDTHFAPSFSTLTDNSKEAIITSVLLSVGYNRVITARVGDADGVSSQYMAVADDKRLSWEDLTNIPEFRTILELKGDYYG